MSSSDAPASSAHFAATKSVEMPPGDVLTRLAEVAFPEARCVAVDGGDFESALTLMDRARDGTQ